MIGFHPFLEVHISPMVRQRITCTTLSFMSYPFLLFIHFLHLARQHWQWRQEFLCFLQESNAPQQRKNSAKTYVLSFAFLKLANGENAHTSLYSHLFLSEIAEQTILLESSSQF